LSGIYESTNLADLEESLANQTREGKARGLKLVKMLYRKEGEILMASFPKNQKPFSIEG